MTPQEWILHRDATRDRRRREKLMGVVPSSTPEHSDPQYNADIAILYNHVGHVRLQLGEVNASLDAFTACKIITGAVKGTNTTYYAEALNDVGYVCESLRNFSCALENYDAALQLRTTHLGESHDDTAGSLNNMGTVLMELSKHNESEPYLLKALRIRKALAAEIAGQMRKPQKRKEQKSTDRAAFAARLRAMYLERVQWTIEAHSNLGACYLGMGEYAMCMDHYWQTLALIRFVSRFQGHRRIDSSAHKRIAVVRERLNNLFKTMHDRFPTYKQAVHKLHSSVGAHHPLLNRMILKVQFIESAMEAVRQHKEESQLFGDRSEPWLNGAVGDGYWTAFRKAPDDSPPGTPEKPIPRFNSLPSGKSNVSLELNLARLDERLQKLLQEDWEPGDPEEASVTAIKRRMANIREQLGIEARADDTVGQDGFREDIGMGADNNHRTGDEL